MSKKIIPAIVLCFQIIGCATLDPQYSRPEPPVPAEWPSGNAYQTLAAVDESLRQKLKREFYFTDPKLSAVIDLALINNRDLRMAVLNVEKARALYRIQEAQVFPVLGVAGNISQQRLPADVSGAGKAITAEQYSVNFGASAWEIDFFGRVRSLEKQALQNYLATEQAARSAQISLVSAVAGSYLSLAADRERLKLARQTLQLQQERYNLIKRRHQVGVSSEIDLHQAQTLVDSAQLDVVSYTRTAATAENALNLLLGFPLPPELLPESLEPFSSLKKPAPGLPSETLLRRPDILQAENMLKAANASIGAARAAFFPRISLTTGFGTISSELSGLFKSGSGSWAFSPQIVLPIFDFGQRLANLKAAEAEAKIMTAQYEKVIQTAFREVADALAATGTIDTQIEAQKSLLRALSETNRLADLRYKYGIDSYLSVLEAQRSLYSAEQGLIGLNLASLGARLALYKALGGGAQ